MFNEKSSLCIQCDHLYFCVAFNNKLCPRDEINYQMPYAPVLMPEIIYYWLFGTLYKPSKESLMFLSFLKNIISKWEPIRLNVPLTEYFNNL